MKLTTIIESIVLTLFVGFFLYVGLANPFENALSHDRPFAHGASDAYFHQSLVDYMINQGRIYFTPSYEVGGHENVLDQHPPGLYQLSASLSVLSGIEAHDSIYIMTVITFLLGILILYLIVRRVKREIAYLMLPACILIFSQTFNLLFFWGLWLLIAGVTFMIAILWATLYFDTKNVFVLLGIFFGATVITHIPEAVYAVIFIGLYLVYEFVKKRAINLKKIKLFSFSALIGLVFSFFYANILYRTGLRSEGYRNVWDLQNVARLSGLPELPLSLLGWVGIIALLGFVVFIISKKKRDLVNASFVFLFLFLVNYFFLLGVGKRAYIHRLFFYVYISFFFGLCLYYLIKLIAKNLSGLAAPVLGIVLIIMFSLPLVGATRIGSSILDQDSWNGLVWLRENVPKKAPVYYFYGEVFTHRAVLYNSYHVSFAINTRDFISKIQSGSFHREYRFDLIDSYHDYLCPLGTLKYGYFRNRLEPENLEGYNCEEGWEDLEEPPESALVKDVCDIEYVVFSRAAFQQAMAQYNFAVRQILLDGGNFEEVYQNNVISILKNNDVGAECIGQEQTE